MNATEIFAVMDKVTREAWPEGVTYAAETERNYAQFRVYGQAIPDHHAELLFEAAMARHLDKHENHWTVSRSNTDYTVFSACMGTEAKRLGSGPTKLEALAAACGQIGGGA